MLRETYCEVSLSNFRHNIRVLRAMCPQGVKFLAVIKANAYGHGIRACGMAALEAGADYLGVAIADEGDVLRETGITAPILIIGATAPRAMEHVLDSGLTPTIFTCGALLHLQQTAERLGVTAPFHFKIDSGMNRIGFRSLDEFEKALSLLADCPNLRFDGMFTHFAVSEIEDKSFTAGQAARFSAFVAAARARGYSPVVHASNSGAILDLPQFCYDMVRGGIAMYGYHPNGKPCEALLPVLSWKTEVSHVKRIEAGEGVSYGLTYVATRPTTVATLPVGYGDGYKRTFSNRAEVLIHGKRVRQIGTVCMDQILCDVTELADVQTGDEAVLLGRQGDARITADELAAWGDTISYEILLSISDRVPRVYI